MPTELQTRKWTRLFQVYDVDRNGVIEKEDFEAICQNFATARNLTQGTPQYQELHEKFMEDWKCLQKDADQNNNGKIELAEWLQYSDRRINSPNTYQIVVDLANQVFELLDIDGDGVIGLEEYKTFCWSWRLPEDLAVENFPNLDLNGDGNINKNEFLKLVRQFYRGDDLDAPGNSLFGSYTTTLQKRKWTRLFQVYDADRNGVIEKDDFEAIFHNLATARNLTQEMPQYEELHGTFMKDWEYLQKDADQNNNGKIELAEWLQYSDRRINSPNIYQIVVDLANQIFELLDIDGDGVISVEEYKTFYWSWRIPEDLAIEIFAKLDLNGDGSINKKQFLRLLREFHHSNDPDAPGNLFFAYY